MRGALQKNSLTLNNLSFWYQTSSSSSGWYGCCSNCRSSLERERILRRDTILSWNKKKKENGRKKKMRMSLINMFPSRLGFLVGDSLQTWPAAPGLVLNYQFKLKCINIGRPISAKSQLFIRPVIPAWSDTSSAVERHRIRTSTDKWNHLSRRNDNINCLQCDNVLPSHYCSHRDAYDVNSHGIHCPRVAAGIWNILLCFGRYCWLPPHRRQYVHHKRRNKEDRLDANKRAQFGSPHSPFVAWK